MGSPRADAALSKPKPPARSHDSLTLGTLEALWDEAVAYRQPSTDQVVRAHCRWLLQSGHEEAELQLKTLTGDDTAQLVQQMVQVERRLQLRVRGEATGHWRPPCAVGEKACSGIEAALHSWRQLLPSGAGPRDTPALETLLLPNFCLFELIVAGSYLHRRELARARQFLDYVEGAVDGAPLESYLFAVGPQLKARVSLQRARLALLSKDFEAAVATSRAALASLQDRRGPRDFWPPHCWEIAACHRIMALGLAQGGRLRKVVPVLLEQQPFLSPAPMCTVQPQLAASLTEDARALRLECDVACHLDASVEKWNAPLELRTLLRDVEAFLAGARLPAIRSSMQVAAAKLTLLQELPWCVAGSARREALDGVMAQLAAARAACERPALVQKVLPVEVACIVMRGDTRTALASASAWAKECAAYFGEEDGGCQSARQLIEELSAIPEATVWGTSTGAPQPRKALQQSLHSALVSTGVGYRDPSKLRPKA